MAESQGEASPSREFTVNKPHEELSKQRGAPKGIPFTFLTESQSGKTEGRKGETYSPEVYLRVVDNLRQIFLEANPIQETIEQERGVNNTLLMVCLGLQAIAYDHLGPEGQAYFKDELFSLIKSQDWSVQPISRTMRLWQNSFELTVTQGKLLQRIAEGLNLTYDPGGQYDIHKRTFNYDTILQRPITKDPNDPVEYKPLSDREIKAYLQTKKK
jgi:hypothetical protein